MGMFDWLSKEDDEQEVPQGTDQPEQETPAPKAEMVGPPTREDAPKSDLDSFLSSYKTKSEDNTAIKDAESKADRSKMWTGIIQGLSTAFAGHDRTDSNFYNGLRANADQSVADARNAKKQALDNMVQGYQFKRQGVEDQQRATEFGWKQDAANAQAKERTELTDPKSQTSLAAAAAAQSRVDQAIAEGSKVGANVAALKAFRAKLMSGAFSAADIKNAGALGDYKDLLNNQAAMARVTAQENAANTRLKTQMDHDDQKFNRALDVDAQHMSRDLSPASARAGLRKDLQSRVNNAERAYALAYDEHGNVKNLTKPQMAEMAEVMASMMTTGGVTGLERVKALTPQSAWGDAKQLEGWLINNPTGIDQQEFTKVMLQTIAREKGVAELQLKKALAPIATGYVALRRDQPETWKKMVRNAGLDPENDFDPTTGNYIGADPESFALGKHTKKKPVTSAAPAAPVQTVAPVDVFTGPPTQAEVDLVKRYKADPRYKDKSEEEIFKALRKPRVQ